MSVLAFEDFLPAQTNESFNPSKQQNGENTIPNKRPDSMLTHLEVPSGSINHENNNYPLPMGKSTGNTPRFGAVKKIEPLKPLKPRPTRLVTKFSDNTTNEYASLASVGESSHQAGAESPSFVSLSPSNQGRLDTGSVGNSPRRKQCSLKHPFISKKSPLFKKFGFDPKSSSQNNNPNVSVLSCHENTNINNSGTKALSPLVESATMNIKNKYTHNQVAQKQFEDKKSPVVIPKQFGTNSVINPNVNRAHEVFGFYSGKKVQTNPRGPLPTRAVSEAYSSEPQHFDTESSPDWTNNALQGVKARLINVKENIVAKKSIFDPKLPQRYPVQGPGAANTKNRQLSANNSLLRVNNTKENVKDPISQIDMVLGKSKEIIGGDFKRKSLQMNKKILPTRQSVKDNSINESFNSLDLSGIAHDTNERDALNLSKDDALLQYIDRDQSIKEEFQKNKKTPFKLPRQLTYDLDNHNENLDSERSLKKSTSASHLESNEQQSQIQDLTAQQSPFKVPAALRDFLGYKPQRQRAVSQNTSLNGGRRQVTKSFLAEEPLVRAHPPVGEKMYFSGDNRDQNASMFEVPRQYQDQFLFHHEDNETLEHLKQRRAESALTRPTDNSFDEYNSEHNQWRRKNYKEIQKTNVINSEKNNFKHFQFAGSPSMNHSTIDDDPAKLFKKPYLHIKPGTTGSGTRSYMRKESLNARNRVPRSNQPYGFNSIESVQTNLNHSGIDDTSYISQHKVEYSYHVPNGENKIKLPFNIEEQSVRKLRDAIKKLQAKDNDSQMRIAKLHMQLEDKNKDWEKRFEAFEQRWKYKLTQQKEYYKKSIPDNGQKKMQGFEIAQL